MKISQKLKILISNPSDFLIRVLIKYPFLCSDRFFLKIRFKQIFDKKLNLVNPQTYNEKLQWLKLYYRKDIMHLMVDKVKAKVYVQKQIGNEFIIPTLGVWSSFDEINFDVLPNQFVLKTNHDSRGTVICKDKKMLDLIHVKSKLTKSLKNNYYVSGREWAYKDIQPKILAEPYMEDYKTKELRDYKIFCFNGIPKLILVTSDRQKGDEKYNFYDINFNLLPITQTFYKTNNPNNISRPRTLDQMLELAKVLSKDFPHLRVDFYEINGKLYFGELTFYHDAGFKAFHPEKWDYEIGSYLVLPKRLV